MEKRWSLRGENRGASLIAVITTIAVVGIIGVVITQLTITNIQMKAVEQQSKKNFYSAEEIMDSLSVGLNTMAADAMQKAYTDMLAQYEQVTSSGGSVKAVFSEKYLNGLIEIFGAKESEGASDNRSLEARKKTESGTGKVLYQIGYYSIGKVKEALKSASMDKDESGHDICIYTDQQINDIFEKLSFDQSSYRADYTNGTFLLENVEICVEDKLGYETTIKTDMVFHTPDLNFEGSGLVKNFMRYSLIADKEIKVSTTNIKVDGNVYAGSRGIRTFGSSSADFIGKLLVTRGDIEVNAQGTLNIGASDESSQIWVENIRTLNAAASANAPKLTVTGTCYVSDDLELNGYKDEVTLKGKYYGYNFQNNYTASGSSNVDAKYSSAIVINGKESRLDLTGLSYMMIAGRTYIGRNAGTEGAADIPLGESLSVRANQMAYYVPTVYVDTTHNTLSDAAGYAAYCGVANVESYLAAQQVAPYYYTYKGAKQVAYYLNFASDNSANEFFGKYYNSNKTQVDKYAGNYAGADALKINSGVALSLRGDLMYRDGAGNLQERAVTIDSNTWGTGKLNYNISSGNAMKYYTLQRYLEENRSGVDAAKVRIEKHYDTGLDIEDGADCNMFYTLLDQAKLTDFFAGLDASAGGRSIKTIDVKVKTLSGSEIEEHTEQRLLAIVNGDYEVDSSYKGGLVIATGDVSVKSGTGVNGFAGLILAGGEIKFEINNSCVKADEVLIAQMFAQDAMKTNPEFSYLFKVYGDESDGSMGEVRIDKYLSYDRWTKTIE